MHVRQLCLSCSGGAQWWGGLTMLGRKKRKHWIGCVMFYPMWYKTSGYYIVIKQNYQYDIYFDWYIYIYYVYINRFLNNPCVFHLFQKFGCNSIFWFGKNPGEVKFGICFLSWQTLLPWTLHGGIKINLQYRQLPRHWVSKCDYREKPWKKQWLFTGKSTAKSQLLPQLPTESPSNLGKMDGFILC